MQYFSRGSDKYTEIKMCDLEPFSKIRSHMLTVLLEYTNYQLLKIIIILYGECSIRVYKYF